MTDRAALCERGFAPLHEVRTLRDPEELRARFARVGAARVMLDVVAGRCPVCVAHPPVRPIAIGPDFEYRTTDDEMRMVECTRCGTRFLDPCPADHELARIYPPDYEPHRWDELPAPVRAARDLIQRPKLDAVREYASAGARILDVGCGGGALLRRMRAHGDPSWELAGWDRSGPHLDRLAEQGFEVRAAPIDAAHAPPPGSADVIVLSSVLERFARPDALIELLARTLRPGGVLFIETPDVHGLDARIFGRRHWAGYHFPRHLVLFHAQSLCTLLERSGFTIAEVEHLASPAFWIRSVHHRLAESPLARVAPLFSVSNPFALGVATALDLAILKRDRPTSTVRVVARKANGRS